MSYLIFARKYRPQKFSSLTGQETSAKILQSAIAQDRIAPAYLFSGPRGTGKTTSARIFAKALNCQNRQPSVSKPESVEPCNLCSSCEEITKSSSIDVLEMDAASHTGIDNVREVIINTVAYSTVRDKYKVFIIDEVHMLSRESFNALLKTLEEPPPHVVFVLATTEYHKIPATISSRCQRFRFLPLTQKQIGEYLKKVAGIEKVAIADDAIALLARAAAGSMRDGLSLFDQAISQGAGKITLEKVEEILGVVREDFLVEFLQAIAAKDAKAVLISIGKLLNEGFDLSYFLKELREAYRQMLIEKCGYREEGALTNKKKSLPHGQFTVEELLRASQLLSKCAEAMRWNDFPRMVFECYAVKLCQDALDVGEILDRLDNLEGGAPPSGKAPARPGAPRAAPVKSEPAPFPANPSPEIAEASADAPAAQEPTVAAFHQTWRSILEKIHQQKPFLSSALDAAQPLWREGVLELGFSKPFGLDSAKRSQSFLEGLLVQEMKKPVSLILKLAANLSAPEPAVISGGDGDSSEDEDTVVVEELHETFEIMDQGEVFKPIEGSPSPIEDAIEDEGTKKFLTFFHGKVTRHSADPGP